MADNETSTPAAGVGDRDALTQRQALHPTLPVPPLPTGGIMEARAAIMAVVDRLGPALGNAYLVPKAPIGILLWLSFLWAPRHAGFALIGLGVALATQRALGISEESKVGGGLRANSMLSSIAVGWLMAPTAYADRVQVMIAVIAALVAFFITASIMRALRHSTYPSLLWGASVATGIAFALFPIAVDMAARQSPWWQTPPVDGLGWAAMCLKSIGSLMLVPRVEVGLVVVCTVFLWSRTLLVAGLVGWATGALLSIGLQWLGLTFYWLPAAYNFFIAGMAIGAYFIVPGYASLFFAALAGAGAAVTAIALERLMPVFAYLPTSSGLTIWVIMATVAFAGNRRGFWRNGVTNVPPEEAWWAENCWARRIGREEALLVVPLPGVVAVAQGFEGTLSHRGALRHAFDFVRQPAPSGDPGSMRYSMEGTLWNSPVTAPAAGVVERVLDGVADNPLGMCNFAESWGNYVSLRLDQGGWALLAHLRRGSIAVKPGTRVELGDYLAAVGNSGRSPMPHLHLHVQNAPEPGARTVPFRLANFLSAQNGEGPLLTWNASTVPPVGSFVMAARPRPGAHAVLSSMAPGTSVWSVTQTGVVPRAFREAGMATTFEMKIALDEWGRYILTCNGANLRAVLGPDAWRILEQRGDAPLLKLLTLGVPSIPYACEVGVSWTDLAPILPMGRRAWLTMPFAPYRLQPFTYTRAIALSAPADQSGTLSMESVVSPQTRVLPAKILCTFDRLRGPIEVEATFSKGSVKFSMVSFSLADGL